MDATTALHSAGTEIPAPLPKTLELRIHGIRNTPPHELLRTGSKPFDPKDVELSWGDELAGFYRAKPEAAAAHSLGAAANGGSTRLVEAYSWGRLARFTGIGIANKIADAVVRTVWFLLMPFGLTNAAYWSRPLPRVRQLPDDDPGTGSEVTVVGDVAAGPVPSNAAALNPDKPAARLEYANGDRANRSNGAGRIRLFAMLLTLYFVVTAAVVAMDLIAVQCFPADPPPPPEAPAQQGSPFPQRTCAALPSFLDGLAAWTRGQRIALLAVVPLLGVGILAGVAYLARTRFHPRPILRAGVNKKCSTEAGAGAAAGAKVEPTLMIRNLWDARKEVKYNGQLHVWVSVAALAAIISWDGVWTRIDGKECSNLGTFFTTCAPQLWSGRLDFAGFVMGLTWLGGIATMVAAGFQTVRKAEANPDVPARDEPVVKYPLGIAIGAGLSAAVAAMAAALPCPNAKCEGGTAERLLGLGTAPAGLMCFMLLLIALMLLLKRSGYNAQVLGWRGSGPAVFCTLALGTATIMSCAVVGVATAFLQSELDRRAATEDGMWRFGAVTPDVLFPPSVFSLFSGLLLFVIILAVMIWGGCTVVARQRIKAWNTLDAAVNDLATVYSATPPLPYNNAIGRKLLAARSKASLLHRTEAIVSLLAVLIALGLLAALVLGTFKDWWDPNGNSGFYGFIEGVGALGLSAAGAGILALAVSSAKPNSRPLALLWDLMCFMPKAAHPYGPPSYGERAVPEFANRIAAWLDGEEDTAGAAATTLKPKPDPSRKVVISAHSLGAAIAVSALFHLRAIRPDLDFRQIGLVTYGTQLRAYFGRFFPDLFGPGILATAPVSRVKLAEAGGPDTERIDAAGLTGPACVNLADLLGASPDRWINVYRKTDYLGFPVRFEGNAAALPERGDFYAQEMDPYTYQFLVTTHSDYLQAPQYQTAIAAVENAWPAGASGGPGAVVAAAPGGGVDTA